jgi:hypothetical protein
MNMTDFIPGEGYRLDIVGADDSVLVDSWTSQIKADVVNRAGAIQVDTVSGKIYGPMIGDIEDIDGTVLFDLTAKLFSTDVQGDVLDSTGSVFVDHITRSINGNITGNLIAQDNSVMVDSYNSVIRADSFHGEFYGELFGSITSDSIIYGTFNGDFNGTVYGEFYGNTVGNLTGETVGTHTGLVLGDVVGNLQGDLVDKSGTKTLTTYSAELDEYSWLGGISHPNDPAVLGPVLLLGKDRTDSELKANVSHYDGSRVIVLKPTGDVKAELYGNLIGNFAREDAVLMSSTDDSLDIMYLNKNIKINAGDTGSVTITASNYFKRIAVNAPNDPKEVIMTYKGTDDNKIALTPGSIVYEQLVEAYDGTDFKELGSISYVWDNKNHTHVTTDNFIPGALAINLSNGTNEPREDNPNIFIFTGAGVFSTPVIKLGSKTFSQRDSLMPEAGTMIFNSSNNTFQGFNGTSWVDLG